MMAQDIEAIKLLAEGVDKTADMDTAGQQGLNYPMGPLKFGFHTARCCFCDELKDILWNPHPGAQSIDPCWPAGM